MPVISCFRLQKHSTLEVTSYQTADPVRINIGTDS